MIKKNGRENSKQLKMKIKAINLAVAIAIEEEMRKEESNLMHFTVFPIEIEIEIKYSLFERTVIKIFFS